MKIVSLIMLMMLCLSTFGFCDQYVNGYTRGDGTYVQGYYRSSPDGTVQDNYSYKGNTNPYTGQVGDNYYRSNPTSQYYSGSGLNTINNQPAQNYNTGGSNYSAFNSPMNPRYRNMGSQDDNQ